MMRYNFTSERSTDHEDSVDRYFIKESDSESSDSSPVALTGYKLGKVQCHVCIMLWICLNCIDIYYLRNIEWISITYSRVLQRL